ncbi:hypothetical protein E2C01_092768 [Portunus trituberculatus]|uniref:Uncharacterized protein n=1 Tax=Portunus trituberculatus TaxID=210409 RepID=A0A5B7JHA4_PORTR|nr:hypothetical protein [Portunus trituberculatus]
MMREEGGRESFNASDFLPHSSISSGCLSRVKEEWESLTVWSEVEGSKTDAREDTLGSEARSARRGRWGALHQSKGQATGTPILVHIYNVRTGRKDETGTDEGEQD